MAPKNSSATTSRGPRGNAAPKKTSSRSQVHSAQAHSNNSDVDPFADDDISQQRRSGDMDVERGEHGAEAIEVDDEDEETKKTIPPELLTRILHEFFEKDGTRISKDANKAVAKYMDIFVREAIARTAVEKGNGFLEVEDLEKVAPQLLMDL
ncbi:CENP-S associating centromere protein X-domain-containing protein [Xylaria sp. FL0933]|nr:CENP-S associating centromere protein X-domain-containing protein [Xylaria sp. FL0933]